MANTAFFASEAKLHSHRSVSQREKALAEDLCDQIQALGRQEDFVADDRYRQLVKRARSLKAFLFQMSDAMDTFEETVRETAVKTDRMLTNAPDQQLLHPVIDLDA